MNPSRIARLVVCTASLVLALASGCGGDDHAEAPAPLLAERGTVGGVSYEVVETDVPADAPVPAVLAKIVVGGRPAPAQLRAIARHIADEARGQGKRWIWMGFYDRREFALHGGLTLGSARCRVGEGAKGPSPQPASTSFKAAFPSIDWARQPTAFEARVWGVWMRMPTSARKSYARVRRELGLTRAEAEPIIDRCSAWQVPSGIIEW